MAIITKIGFTENVAIISFENAQAHVKILSILFDSVAKAGINVDMISQTAAKGEYNLISFTVSDDDVTTLLSVLNKLKIEHESLIPLISSGNVKISLYGESMPQNPGVAASVFCKLAEDNLDTLLVTTSDVDISIVVTSAIADVTFKKLTAAYGL